MQIDVKEYNAEIHEIFKALTVRQPYADKLIYPAYYQEGQPMAEKQIEVRTRATSYRGELLICSAKTPVIPGRESGATIGMVELYDVKPVSQFTPEDWEMTAIPQAERAKYRKGYGWFMRNPRRVVEMPIKGQLGIYNLVMPMGDLTFYPQVVKVDKRSWNIIKSQTDGNRNKQ